jgi:hypothetical protein
MTGRPEKLSERLRMAEGKKCFIPSLIKIAAQVEALEVENQKLTKANEELLIVWRVEVNQHKYWQQKSYEYRDGAEKAEAEVETQKIYVTAWIKTVKDMQDINESLEATLERVKKLPQKWHEIRHLYMGGQKEYDDCVLGEKIYKRLADELESAVKGESSELEGKS